MRLSRDTSRHVLVTGSHRSGTTWVGRTVALHPKVEYVHEPFHCGNPNELVGLKPDNWFEYVPGSRKKQEIQQTLDRLLKTGPLGVALGKGRVAGLDAKTPLRFGKDLLVGA